MLESTRQLLGNDKKDRPRAVFLYDAKKLCKEYGQPADVSTAILIDSEGSYTHSTAVLRLFLYMGVMYQILGVLLLVLFPRVIRDLGYRLFARNRGQIWKGIKRVTGMGDTIMEPYRDRILGLEEVGKPLDPGWGFLPSTSATVVDDET